MKQIILAVILLCALSCNGQLAPQFVRAINKVEASGKHENVIPGDGGFALGPFQIHKRYWIDAVAYDNTIIGKYEDCEEYDYSVKVMTAYLNRYGRKYVVTGNYEALARIHNGGPQGYFKSDTQAYWKKVKKALDNP